GFLQHVRRDLPLEVTELARDAFDPLQQPIDWELRYVRDGPSGDADLQRLGLQLGPVTVRALASGLVLTQEDADVLLVLFPFEIHEEGQNPLVAARAPVEQLVARRRRQLSPRDVHGYALALGEFGECAAFVVVSGLRPWIDRSVAQRSVRIRDDKRLVVLERRTESVAAFAGAARTIERKELRRRRRCARPVVGALEALREAEQGRGASAEG